LVTKEEQKMSNKEIDPKLLQAAEELSDQESPEEIQDEITDSDVIEVEAETESRPSLKGEEPQEEVLKAKKNGHLSKEEYIEKYGTDKGYKTPEEFNKFGENYHEIKDAVKGINKKLEERNQELAAALKYIDRVREREQKAAREELLRQLKEAQDIGDVEAVRHLTREEAKLDYQEAQEAARVAAEQVSSVVRSFEERNPWYNKDPEMTNRAVQIDAEIRNGKYAHIMPMPQNYEQLGQQIELIIKQEFGDRVRAQNAPAQQPVINNVRSAMNKSGVGESESTRTFKELNSDLKAIYRATKRMLEANGMTYTEAEYIKKLQKDGEI
jgi:hypothetical protein